MNTERALVEIAEALDLNEDAALDYPADVVKAVHCLKRDHDARADTLRSTQTRCTELLEERRQIDRKAMVRAFHCGIGQANPETPAVPDDATVRLRLRLIAEEFCELLDAAYSGPSGSSHWHKGAIESVREELESLIAHAHPNVDLPAFVDATVDIDYVVEGTRIAFGVDSTPVWAEVQRANMAKLGGPKRASDGKQMKPPGWTPPDIAGRLREMRWRDEKEAAE